MKEKAIEKAVCDYAKKLGFLTYKFSSPSQKGVPDRIFINKTGLVLFVEFKKTQGKLTLLQKITHEKLKLHLCKIYTIDDVCEAKGILNKYLNSKVIID